MTEEKKLSKTELFEQEPDNFFHLSELILAVKKDPNDINKISIFAGEKSEFRLRGALGVLTSFVEHMITSMKMESMENSKLIKEVQQHANKSGFRNFIKGGK